jgi:arylsulfatase A
MNRSTIIARFLSLLALLALASPASAEIQPPNVILIMADDLGYNDLSCYGHSEIKTPVLDQLAKDGIRLTSFYSGATVCTPSRMSLLTGAYPSRLGWTQGVVGYLISTKQGLNPKALTMAEVFKTKGYATGLIGKWHLGDSEPLRPHRQGFDATYYINKSNNQTKTIWRGDEVVEKPFDNRLLTEQFTSEAVSFIQSNKNKPFFLYLPFTAPHFPVQSHPDWKGKSAFERESPESRVRDYGDVVEELDHRIGDILKTLKTEKLDQNTIVIFTSDNGPQGRELAQAKPYRGKKWGSLEGGTRVPCIVRWPGVIPAGKESNQLIGAIDFLPTLSHACGIDLKAVSNNSPVIDGVNILDTLTGKVGVSHQRKDLLYWHGKSGFHAIRVGDWKLFLNREGAELPNDTGSGLVLINLANDDEELTDLSRKFPEKVQEMQVLAKKRLANIKAHTLPLGGQKPVSKPAE